MSNAARTASHLTNLSFVSPTAAINLPVSGLRCVGAQWLVHGRAPRGVHGLLEQTALIPHTTASYSHRAKLLSHAEGS